MRAALPLIEDTDAGRKLADHKLATVDDKGNVTGMDELVENVEGPPLLGRDYPYLERPVDTSPFVVGAGSTPANGRHSASDRALSRTALQKKHPALRGRGRG